MELLARFELATGFHEICDFAEALRPPIEIDEVASSNPHKTIKEVPDRMVEDFFWSC